MIHQVEGVFFFLSFAEVQGEKRKREERREKREERREKREERREKKENQ